MDNTIDHTFESANRVYDIKGISPTIPTSCGGGHTPKVIQKMNKQNQIIELNREGGHQQDLLMSPEGICRCIPAGTHGSTPHLLKILVKVKDD